MQLTLHGNFVGTTPILHGLRDLKANHDFVGNKNLIIRKIDVLNGYFVWLADFSWGINHTIS